jgi:hypothetical protein
LSAAIREYRFDPHNVDEIVRRAEAGLVTLIREAPGFVSYRLGVGRTDSSSP